MVPQMCSSHLWITDCFRPLSWYLEMSSEEYAAAGLLMIDQKSELVVASDTCHFRVSQNNTDRFCEKKTWSTACENMARDICVTVSINGIPVDSHHVSRETFYELQQFTNVIYFTTNQLLRRTATRLLKF